jgi:ArsR family transcriptional regulator, arsenate/arsenite/antimonite-responsive transcriptional repressor
VFQYANKFDKDQSISSMIFDRVSLMAAQTINLDPIACCPPVRSAQLDAAQAELVAKSFAALSDPIRLRLLSHVASAGGDEVCACDLGEIVDRSQPTVSHHMKILHDAGLISRDKRGLWVWYRIIPERLEALRAVLATAD